TEIGYKLYNSEWWQRKDQGWLKIMAVCNIMGLFIFMILHNLYIKIIQNNILFYPIQNQSKQHVKCCITVNSHIFLQIVKRFFLTLLFATLVKLSSMTKKGCVIKILN
ncbi:hypothetical protein ACJX0J_034971, partial [Zea mays]